MAPVSDDRWLKSAPSELSWMTPGETESGSAGTQPGKGYPGRRCADGASGLWWRELPEAVFLSPSDTGAMPQKIRPRFLHPSDVGKAHENKGESHISSRLSPTRFAEEPLYLWGETRFRAPFPSVPQWFLFPGRTGHPPTRFGWSPVVPGTFGKESARNETRFLKKPQRGRGEGTD
jgi:hypothetical protein